MIKLQLHTPDLTSEQVRYEVVDGYGKLMELVK
jgi:hypothetical protein